MEPSRLGCAAFVLISSLAGCSTPAEAERTRASSWPLTTPGLFFQGQNFSGAERGFGAAIEESWGAALPGVEGSTYWWPTPDKNALPAGMNIVRLPFQWERLQPELNGAFDPSYLAKLHATAEAWRALGATVLLDVHNYAYYKVVGRGTKEAGQHLGSKDVPSAALADFWRRMAERSPRNFLASAGVSRACRVFQLAALV